MANSSPIALFDSGIGGLSVLLEIKKKLPLENLIYFADQAFFPYGTKTKLEIIDRCNIISEFLVKHRAKMIVVACNTASVHALSTLREKTSIPIVGVVPAIKPASELNSKNIGIMATNSTLSSTDFKKLLSKFSQKKQVYKIKSTGLEQAIEKYNLEKIDQILNYSKKLIISKKIDTIVLGCTHYPIIKKQIKKILGSKINIIDSHIAIAKRVKSVLKSNDDYSRIKKSEIFFTTGNIQEFTTIASSLLNYKIEAQSPLL